MKKNNAHFNQQIVDQMNELDRELTTKMVLRTASKEDVFVFLLELGRLHGYDLTRGSRCYIHPDNLPIGYQFRNGDVITPSHTAAPHEVLFINKMGGGVR